MTPVTSGSAGKTMMQRLLRTYFWWKGGLGDMSRNLRGGKQKNGKGGFDAKKRGTMPSNYGGGRNGRDSASGPSRGGGGPPSYKRRRIRGGSVAASVTSGRKEIDKDTGEEEIVGAELEDEAEGIADLYVPTALLAYPCWVPVHDGRKVVLLLISHAALFFYSLQSASQQFRSSVEPESDLDLSGTSFFREPSMGPPQLPPSSSGSSSGTRDPHIRSPSTALSDTDDEIRSSFSRDLSEAPSLFEREFSLDASSTSGSPPPPLRSRSESMTPLRSFSRDGSLASTTSELSLAPPQTLLRPSAQATMTDFFDPLGFEGNFGLLSAEDLVVVRPYKGDDDDQVLEELRPKYIVMYDPDPGFIRRIEVSMPIS